MRNGLILCAFVCVVAMSCRNSHTGPTTEPPASPVAEFAALRAAYVEDLRQVEQGRNEAWWESNTTGSEQAEEQYETQELAYRQLHSSRETYAAIERLRDSGQITDPAMARSLEMMYWAFHENQLDDTMIAQLVDMSTRLEGLYSSHRPEVNGEPVGANDIRQVLKESDDSEQRRIMWQASKDIGQHVAPGLVELARLRNQAAQSLGHANYYEMKLRVNEQDPEQIQQVFDELAAMTDEPFGHIKERLDAQLAERFGIDPSELRPWHYADPFFQESPGTGVDIDPFFASDDQNHLVSMATSFFAGIGLPVTEVLERSDLFERDNKNQHAFCIDIDRAGDIRILTNLRNNEQWAGTLFHELGHAVYDVYIDQALPYELRSPAHTFTTEGVAELFGFLSRDPVWLRRHGDVPADAPENIDALVVEEHRMGLLIFARWTLVMLNFERGLYENPDQDLNRLWWSLVERYQGINPPDDVDGGTHFATKIHLVVAPVYYHNYMLGRMYAAQLRSHLSQAVPETMGTGEFDMTGHQSVGRYLIDNVFRPGALYPWPEFVQRSTGEPLTARHFAAAIEPPPPPAPEPPASEAPPSEG